ncbi:hypothetical protein VTN31DRAFT_3142 [Thermomyces dupontii]|uniref:uncharacterized protein n=1 Tax=Talaromyces thermophilus TaxID=28565 RepID=UPI0037425B25
MNSRTEFADRSAAGSGSKARNVTYAQGSSAAKAERWGQARANRIRLAVSAPINSRRRESCTTSLLLDNCSLRQRPQQVRKVPLKTQLQVWRSSPNKQTCGTTCET